MGSVFGSLAYLTKHNNLQLHAFVFLFGRDKISFIFDC